jgi:hypothetical protein
MRLDGLNIICRDIREAQTEALYRHEYKDIGVRRVVDAD